MSMKTADASNPLLGAIRAEAIKLAWAAFEEVKGQTIPLHFKVLGIPINLNVSLASLRGVMEAVTGETEGQYLAPVNLDDVVGYPQRTEPMPIVTVLVTLVIVGLILYLITTYVPMAPPVKTVLTVVVVLLLCLWLASAFGLIGGSVGNVRLR